MRRHECRAHPLASRPRRRVVRRGITLIELLLSASLGVVVLVAATVMLLSASRMRRNQQLLSDANQEARTAMRHVARTLASAGAGGNTFTFMDVDSAKQTQIPVVFFKNGAGVGPTKTGAVPLKDMAGVDVPSSITTTTMKQQPDEIIVLRYASDRRSDLMGNLSGTALTMTPDPRPPDTAGVVPEIFLKGESALITNFKQAMLVPVTTAKVNLGTHLLEVTVGVNPALLQHPQVTIQPGAAVFPAKVIRYRLGYVPKTARTPERTDLLMETLDPATLLKPNPVMVNQVVLARDVEDFQVQWGYDHNDDGVADDGFTDTGPTPQLMDPLLTYARINISVRTSLTLVDDKGEFIPNIKTEMSSFELGLDESMGGTPLPAAKANGYRRRVMSTVVALKNIAATRI